MKPQQAFPMPYNGFQGMTLRDYFAAQAFAMLMHPNANDLSPKATAEEAYRLADAMLEARK